MKPQHKHKHKMKKAVLSFAIAAAIAAAFSSCTASRNTGNSYQKHLQHRHTGAHHLSNGNGGCGWSNN